MINIAFRQQDDDGLFPLTLTRHAFDLRIGILTIAEKWHRLIGRVPALDDGKDAGATKLSPALIPSKALAEAIVNGENLDEAVTSSKTIVHPWQIFQWNDEELRNDFELITEGRVSGTVPQNVSLIGSNLFVEKGAKLSHCTINTETGPVYIAANAEVMEGATIRGPFALGEGAVVKMGAKIYGATTIGPYCVVGGEIKNSVLIGYSNKAHDGYLGDSVVGEWCNFGAGTSVSNVKNNAGSVKIWDSHKREFIHSGMQKCGLIMGDYSRAAINTSFNTGSVIGVCANVFGEGLMPKYIPSFSWGMEHLSRYEFDKALKDIENWKKLKNAILSEPEKKRLKLIFDQI